MGHGLTFNPWLGVEDGREPAGAERDAYASFAGAAFERYGPGGTDADDPRRPVRYFQVGNELQDVPPPDEYLDALEITAEAGW